MIYDMLSSDTVKRVWKAFQAHSECINKKYEKFKGENTYWTSDRERFVGRFFRKYTGRYIAFMDQQIIGYTIGNSSYYHEPTSVYMDKAWKNSTNQGEPVYRRQKKYLYVAAFRAVNELYGPGHIEMCCTDTYGNPFNVYLGESSLRSVQFKEIPQQEFEDVARLFLDDREDIPFRVTRYLTCDEIKERKIKEDGLVKETVEVMARDMREAAKKVVNAIEVERI